MSAKLSERMSAIADLVTPGSRLADVGCDHAYIPIELCLTGVICSAIAMDVKEGPLARAREHIEENGLDDVIEVRRSDGLENLGEEEADTILIAGMGGLLIKKILTEREIPSGVGEMILQPQSETAALRRCIRELGFFITDEDMVLEDGKFYPMMKVRRGPAPDRNGMDPEMADEFGPVLLSRRDPVLYKWLKKELTVTDGILGQLCGELSHTPNAENLISRREEMTRRKSLLLAALDYYR